MIVNAENITKSFGQLQVLKGVDFKADEAEVVAIMGASGAGKSTLLQILGTLSTPDSGSLTIDGTDVLRLGSRDLASFRNRRIGFVFQAHHLLPEFTALENVMIPGLIGGKSSREARQRAEELLETVGLGKRLPKMPIGMVEVLLWAAVLLAGWLLGGPVGIGTLISTFGAGLVMQVVYNLLKFEPRQIRHRDVLNTMATEQSLLGVFYDGLQRLSKEVQLPEETVLLWFVQNEQIVGTNRAVDAAVIKVARRFAKRGYGCCLLKGQGNALMYPRPSLPVRIQSRISSSGSPKNCSPPSSSKARRAR